MSFAALDRWFANSLPTDRAKDIYPRAMRRLAERGLLRGDAVTRTRDCFLMHTNRVDALKWCVHYFGEWEPQISEAMRALVPEGGTVIDIGGNVGYNALLAWKLVGPRGRVLTFEPCAATFAELQKNLALNSATNVEAYRLAVSDQCGTATLHCLTESEQASLEFRDGTIRAEEVPTIDFAEIARMVDLATVDLIKVDVEGAEDRVLCGLADFADRFQGSIIAEIWDKHDATRLLAPFVGNGRTAARLANDYRTGFYRRHGIIDLLPVSTETQDIIVSRLHTLQHR